MNRIETLSLNQSDQDVATVAKRVVETLGMELSGTVSDLERDAKTFRGKVGDGVTKFLTLVGIMRGVEFPKGSLSRWIAPPQRG